MGRQGVDSLRKRASAPRPPPPSTKSAPGCQYFFYFKGGRVWQYSNGDEARLFCFSTLTLINFFMPCETGEKMGYGITLFLALCVNLLAISSMLPHTGEELPIIRMSHLVITFSSPMVPRNKLPQPKKKERIEQLIIYEFCTL